MGGVTKLRVPSFEPLVLVFEALSCAVSLLQPPAVVVYRSASRLEGVLLDVDSGQMARYQKVRLGDPGPRQVCPVCERGCHRHGGFHQEASEGAWFLFVCLFGLFTTDQHGVRLIPSCWEVFSGYFRVLTSGF